MGGDEELARGIGRMDPFGYGGQYGGGGGGGRYGIQNQFEPPRPAPNADGWSSGDDYLTWNDQQQQQQQQQQPQHHHPRDDHFGQNSHQHNQYRTPAQSRLHYNQQQYQQQRQQQQQWNMAAQPQWNLGASEFVPKYAIFFNFKTDWAKTNFLSRNYHEFQYLKNVNFVKNDTLKM